MIRDGMDEKLLRQTAGFPNQNIHSDVADRLRARIGLPCELLPADVRVGPESEARLEGIARARRHGVAGELRLIVPACRQLRCDCDLCGLLGVVAGEQIDQQGFAAGDTDFRRGHEVVERVEIVCRGEKRVEAPSVTDFEG